MYSDTLIANLTTNYYYKYAANLPSHLGASTYIHTHTHTATRPTDSHSTHTGAYASEDRKF